MKIIFLDIEGVLMNLAAEGPDAGADPAIVARLNRLAEKTGAGLVVSSTWRSQGLDEITALLTEWGVKAPVVGITDDLSYLDMTTPLGIHRGDEIGQWLDTHPGVEAFVILDDDDDMAGLYPFLIQIKPDLGLTDEQVERAEVLLNTAAP